MPSMSDRPVQPEAKGTEAVLPLFERYRPRTFAEVVGQDAALLRLSLLRERGGLAGRVYVIVGPSGSGKTTIGRLIAAEVSADHATVEMDAADLDLDAVREIERRSRGRALGGAKWCYLVNEMHRLRGPVVSRLLTTIETPSVQRNVTIIFTTTAAGSRLFEDEAFDAGPFVSRAVVIRLAQRGLCEVFAEMVQRIARAESLDGQPIERYRRLMKECKNNARLALQKIEQGEMSLAAEGAGDGE